MNKQNENKKPVSDGIDVEFSRELADHDDLEANARAAAADARQKRQSKKNKSYLSLFSIGIYYPRKINREMLSVYFRYLFI